MQIIISINIKCKTNISINKYHKMECTLNSLQIKT